MIIDLKTRLFRGWVFLCLNCCRLKNYLYICRVITNNYKTMGPQNIENMSNFEAAWEALSLEIQKEVRALIKTSCHLRTDYQFNDRRTGRVRIRSYEATRIEKAFKVYGIDATTGKEIE